MFRSLVVIIATLLLLPSCAFFFTKKSQNLVVKTGNESSEVFIDNKFVGKGDCVKTKIDSRLHKQIVIKRDGFKDNYDALRLKKMAKTYKRLLILDALLIPVTIGVSFIGSFGMVNSCKRFDEINYMEAKYKLPIKESVNKYIELSSIRFKIKNKQEGIISMSLAYPVNIDEEILKKEKLLENKKSPDLSESPNNRMIIDKENYLNTSDSRFTENIHKLIKKGKYLDSTQSVFKDRSGTLFVDGEISKVYFYDIRLDGWAYQYLLKSKVLVKWYLKNSYGELMDSIETKTNSGNFYIRLKEGSDQKEEVRDLWSKALEDAVENSYLEMTESNIFKSNIKYERKDHVSNEIFTLTQPKNIVMNETDANLATVIIKTNEGHGTGFAITNDGYILTNYHLLAGKIVGKLNSAKIIDFSGEEIPCDIVRYSSLHDIVLLKVNKNFEKAFNCSNIKKFKKLENVFTIGTPESIKLGQSISYGIISNERNFNGEDFLQTSMSVNSGNSGGPVFGEKGDLYGVMSSKLVGKNTEGISFAIPSHLICDYLHLKIE